mgnify:CR=1 FL=1
MANFLKRSTGITVIALVVTVTVMLILAGVTIKMVTGEKGTVKQANKSVDEYTIGKEKENLKLAFSKFQMDYLETGKGFTKDEYETELKKYDSEVEVEEPVSEEDIEKLGIEISFEESNGGYIKVRYTKTSNEYIVTLIKGRTSDSDNDNNNPSEPTKFTVTYNANGGQNAPESQTKMYGIDINISTQEPTKEGSIFKGWSRSKEATTVDYKAGAVYSINANITLYAVWEKQGYTISYDANGGENAPESQNKTAGVDLKISSQSPTKKGYKFEGWSLTKNATEATYQPEGIIGLDRNLTLYAVWKVEEYSITYNLNGGNLTNSNPEKYTIESETITLNNPVKDGVDFIGWTGSNGTQPQKVVQILKGETGSKVYTANYQELIYRVGENYYTTLEKAVESCPTGGSAYTTIEVLKDCNDMSNEISIKNKKIIINMNNHTVITSKTINIDENSSTQIIGTGTIKNNTDVAISVKGELTLGENDDKDPSTETPKIESTTTGIISTGKLNFYDGVVIGKKSIDGTITDTPNMNDDEKYIVITVNEEDGTQQSYLSTPVAYPVKINNIYYSSLGEAVTKCEEGQTITMLRGIVLGTAEEIPSDKNIIIDLNGKTLSSNSSDYVIKNNGKLEIKDTSAQDEKGKITSTTSDIIYNAENAKLVISNGTLEERSNNKKAIDNNGEVTLKGAGKIVTASNYSYSIYNNTTGTVNIAENSIITMSDGYEAYGIYNNAGTVKISGGTMSGTYSFKAVDNESGTIIVSGGTIEGTSGARSTIINNGTGNVNIEGGTIKNSIAHNGTGTIKMTGGEIVTSNCNGIENNSTGTVLIENGTINADGAYAICNNSTGNVKITNGTIVGNNTSYRDSKRSVIINKSTGIIEVEGGNIQTNNCAYVIYNAAEGIISIGKKDGNVSTEEPIFTNTTYTAIYNQLGILRFYDGLLKSKKETVLGEISEVEDGYNISTTTVNELNVTKLEKAENVAQIGDTYYDTLQKAVDSCSKNAGEETTEIKILKDISIIENSVEVTDGQNIKINLNGHKIENFVSTGAIINDGTLEICDDLNTGYINGYIDEVTIMNNNKLLISSGTIKATQIRTDATGIVIKNNGDLNMTGGTVMAGGRTYVNDYGNSREAYIKAISNCDGAILTIGDGATVKASSIAVYLIYNEGNGTINVEGGNITGDRSSYINGIYNEGTGIINVSGGTISVNGDSTGISNSQNGTLNMTGGEITVSSTYYSEAIINSGEANISNAKIGGSKLEIYNGITKIENSTINGNITISRGSMTITTSNLSGTITNNNDAEINIIDSTITSYIRNEKSGTMTLEGTTVNTSSSYGIYNGSTGTIWIKSGTVKATGSSTSMSSSYSGIFNSSTGTVMIGEKDGNVNSDSPDISGTQYGVYLNNASGKLYFYDGVLKGKVNAKNVTPTEIEEGYELIEERDEETQIEKAYITEPTTIAKMNNIEYKNFKELQEAIAELGDNQQTIIEILRDMSLLSTGEGLEIPENKNIVLDLNGYKIATGKEGTITNNGMLSITDTSDIAGSVISSVSNSIINNGTLKINKITFSTTQEIGIQNNGTLDVLGGVISGAGGSNYTYIINNKDEGIVTIKEGTTIKANASKVYMLYNEGNGTINVEGGNITGDRYSYTIGIYNKDTGTINVSGGTISVNGDSTGISNSQNGTLNMTGGEITVSSTYYSEAIINSGEANISNAKIGGSKLEIYNGITKIENSTINGNITISRGSMTITTSNLSGTITNNNDAEINIIDSTITSYIRNEKSGTMTLEGTTVNTSSSYGIYNGSTGTIWIKSGTVKATGSSTSMSSSYSGIFNSSTGTVMIGEKDGNVNSDSPDISGTQYGVYLNNASGKLYFYDGILKGKVNAKNVTPIEIEEGYELIEERDEETQIEKAYISQPLSAVKMNNVEYKNFKELSDKIATLDDNQQTTVEILRNISLLENGVGLTIPENKNIEVDLKGYKISTGKQETIVNNGTLKITDTSETAGSIVSSTLDSIINNGILKIDNGTLSMKGIKTAVVQNNGTLEMTGGVIEASGPSNYDKGYGINNKDGGVVTIKEGATIRSNGSGVYLVYNEGNGEVNLEGGTITGAGYSTGIYNNGTGIVNIKSGTINETSSDSTGVYNNGTGTINMTGGTILEVPNGYYAPTYGIYNRSTGNVNFNGGEINGGGNGIYNASMGNVSINDGVLAGDGVTIYNSDLGVITINGGTITSKQTNYPVANNGQGIIKVTGGTITGKQYGIFNQGKGVITIGEKGGNVVTKTPVIKGEDYGIYLGNTLGVFNFYDGTIKGKKAYKYGSVTDIEPYYEVKITTKDEYQCGELTLSTVTNMQALVNGTYYSSIQTAINACAENDHVVLINGANITEALTIESGKNIVLDLAGFTINSTSPDYAIINKGTLRIMDSSENKEGSITNKNGVAINNTGTLVVDDDVKIVNGT